jgi:hypothetical protein
MALIMKLPSTFFIFILFLIYSLPAEAKNITNDQGCSTKKIQLMKPTYPPTDFQGYGLVTFTINKNGSVSKVRSSKSVCAISRNDDGSIRFKPCPFFKKSSVDAAKYLKYEPPVDKDGKSCSLESHPYRYTYSFYSIDFDDNNQFLLNSERDHILEQNFQSSEEEEVFLREIISGKKYIK